MGSDPVIVVANSVYRHDQSIEWEFIIFIIIITHNTFVQRLGGRIPRE